MQFSNLEEMIRHIVTNNVDVSSIDFPFPETNTPDSVEVGAEEVLPDETEVEPRLEHVSIAIVTASGMVFERTLQDSETVIVDEFYVVPNSCGAGFVVIDGVKMQLNMCQDGDSTTAYFNTIRDGVTTYNNPLKIITRDSA